MSGSGFVLLFWTLPTNVRGGGGGGGGGVDDGLGSRGRGGEGRGESFPMDANARGVAWMVLMGTPFTKSSPVSTNVRGMDDRHWAHQELSNE